MRKVDRLASVDYIEQIFDEFMELHGDRQFRDDPAIVGGVAYLDGQPVTVIGVHKGKDLKECMHRNYGMPSPKGYRKALRLMKQAENLSVGGHYICEHLRRLLRHGGGGARTGREAIAKPV